MYCKNCGKELKSENKFCPFCGTEAGNMAEPVSSPDGQKKPKKKLWMVLPAVLAAVCIAFGVYKVVNTTSENGAKEEWVATVEEGGTWYVINGKNEKLAEVLLDGIVSISNFNTYGIAQIDLEEDGEGKIAYLNTDGEIFAQPFKRCEAFNYGSDLWEGEPGSNWYLGMGIWEQEGKYGFIDKEGAVKIPLIYDEVFGFQANGLAPVRVDEKWGFINTEGDMLVEPAYSSVWSTNRGELSLAVKEDGERNFIDGSGNIQISTDYNVYAFNEYGLAEVSVDEKSGCMNIQGEMVAEPVYDKIKIHGQYIEVIDGDESLIIDSEGNIIIGPIYGATLWDESNGMWVFLKFVDGEMKFGVLNRENEVIIDYLSDSVRIVGEEGILASFSDEESADTEKVLFLGRDGEVKKEWECEKENSALNTVFNQTAKEDEAYMINAGKGCYFMDMQGEIYMKTGRIDFIYPYVSFHGGPLAVNKLGKWGYIDSEGKMMIDCQYDSAGAFFDKSALD